ncbi:hypothetical protein CAEBREN_13717 [Caenorhabditis brenneri]|uniref:Uncharacterized protein n=1 Tax=Caenorhabditis brenneri TaxID=135651 RepID=G0MTZ8_CAEBE|nr:hypothetical protein CAEBREN_13717 [Caenorhabditis brenneri]
MDSSEDLYSPSSSASTPNSLAATEECAVCGNKVVDSSRYGAPGCLGCIVFFRRAIVRNSVFKCLRRGGCNITNEYRCVCRYCRLQKCLKVGMSPKAVQRRDLVGRRNLSDIKTNLEKLSGIHTTSQVVIDESTSNLLQSLAQLQSEQTYKALQYFVAHGHPNRINSSSRRADSHDVNITLKLCLNQASEWGHQLKPFKRLSIESKQSILAEYVFAFLLVDQSFKTAREAEKGFWLLQNDSFMHPNYFLGLIENKEIDETTKKTAEHHEKFVSELLYCIASPFRNLEIDEIECVALKTILLLTPSCSKRAVYSGQEGYVAAVHTQCMEDLMEHCQKKFPERGEERFGEILLLIGSIRCGIKAIYNHTRISDVFDFNKFDEDVQKFLLS